MFDRWEVFHRVVTGSLKVPLRIFKISLWLLIINLSPFQLTAQASWLDTTGVHVDPLLYKQLFEVEALSFSNPTEALQQNLKIKELCNENGEARLEAIANTNIAVILRHQGFYAQSLEHYLLALDYIQLTKDSLNLGWFYVDVGNIYFHQQLYEKARWYYQKSLELYQKTGMFYAQATALNNLGLIAIEEGNPELALELFFKALALREKGDHPYLLVHSWQYIGDLYFQLGNLPEAMNYYRKILDVGIVEGDFNSTGSSHQGMGEIKLHTGNKTEALDHFRQAEQNYINESSPELLAQLYLNLADIFQQEQNKDSIYTYLNKAYEVSHQQNLFTIEKEALNKLIEFFVKNKQAQQALNYHQLLYKTMEGNYHDELQKTTLGMESQLKILEYKKNLVEKNTRLEKNIFIRNSALAFGVMLLAFLVYLYFNFKSKNRTATILHKQKEMLLQQKIEKEKLILHKAQNKLELNQRDLITKATMLQHKNDELKTVKSELEYKMSLLSDASEKSLFNSILNAMDGALNHTDYWKEFETHFVEVFPGFLENISRQFPKLTSDDLKFCAYQKMNLNTKDIALLTGLSVRSVESRRYRLRKKLGLDAHTNLVGFLHSIA